MLTRLRSLFVALILVVMGAMPVCAQTIQAKGKVIDSEGKALAGVSVSAKQDKALHTTTASDGTFSIQVAEKTILVFTLTGKQTVELVATTTPMQVTLPNAAPEKKETTTVVSMRQATSVKSVYYPLWVIDGVIYKEDKNFNVADLASPEAKRLIAAALPGLSESDIQSFQVINDASATALYGQRALGGVISVRTSKAGQGTNSFTYQAELTYRAIPSYREYNILNSQDQMAVFNEMANGKSLDNEAVFIASQYGVYGHLYNSIYNYNDLTGEYGVLNTDAGRAAYLRAAELRNTNWFKELFQHSIRHQHTLTFSTGTQKANYYASLNANLDPGWNKYENSQTYSFNFNADFRPFKGWSFGIRSTASYGKVHYGGDWRPGSYAPTASRTLDPNTFYAYDYTPFNIKHELQHNTRDYKTANLSLQATIDWQPITQLRLSALGALRYRDQYGVTDRDEHSNAAEVYRNISKSIIRSNSDYLYKPLDDPTALPQIVMPYGGIRNSQNIIDERYDGQLKAHYNDTFGGNGEHSLSAVAGLEVFEERHLNEWFDAYGVNYNLGYLTTYSPLLFTNLRNKGKQYYEIRPTLNRGVSLVGNVDYTLLGRYRVNASYRREGTNQFGRARTIRYIPTWNVGGNWSIDQEAFFPKLKPLSSLSMSLSYGMSGTIPYVHNALPRLKTLLPFFGDANLIEPGVYIDEPANYDLTYEKMYELNWGLNFGLFDERISAGITLFNRQGRDLIDQVFPQGTGGFVDFLYGNVAQMSAKGIELSLTTQNIRTRDFSWSTSITYSRNTNKVTRLNTSPSVKNLTDEKGAARQGYPLNSLFSIPFYKLDENGHPRFFLPDGADVLPDGRHITSPKMGGQVSWTASKPEEIDYLVYSGTRTPTDQGGINNSFSFKNFRLGVYVYYSFGGVKRLPEQFATKYNDHQVMGKEFNRRWLRAGDEERTNVPVIATDAHRQANPYLSNAYTNYNKSDVRIAKTDYIQLRDISLSYTVPKAFVDRLRLSSLALKLQASNVALLYADKKLNGALPYDYDYQPHSYIFTATVGL
ncbi:TonB-dependent receptor [Porphyromonas sp.]|uniref:TonB-dependent receptor domain-containing protein n=1 Tax=Porphyromonas sp. TaxID=1924944 RepID=UPI0025EC16EF|nr:TonB-dependent receptor [Porphyromonas sp.]